MTGWIIRDYFAGFHWKRSTKNFMEPAYWSSIYILFILPIIHDFYNTKEGAITCLAIAIPMFFMRVSIATHMTVELPKIMYLCPMDRKMRREYIEKSCIFRIVLSAIPGMIGIIILLVNGLVNWIGVAGIFFNILVMAFIGSGILSGSKKMVLPIICVYVTLVIDIGYAYAIRLSSDKVVPGWIKWMAVLTVIFIQIPTILRVLKNWNTAIERATDYDKIFVTKLN